MADVFICYASTERAGAVAVARRLREAGLLVWMDDLTDADASLASIGVPVGQDHWAVISQAIDDALVVLVLDSDAWRSSEYCRRELAHAEGRGKRIAVVPLRPPTAPGAPRPTWPVAGLEDLVRRFAEDLDTVSAHGRVLHAALRQAPDRPVRARHVADVRRVLTAGPAVGIALTAEMSEFARRALRDARRRRRARGGIGGIVVVTVAVLAVIALVARSAALGDRADARDEADRQASLELATDSRGAETTLDRESFASQALDRSRTNEAMAASRAIDAEARGLRRFRQDDGPVYTAALVDGGRAVVIGTGTRRTGLGLARLDLDTGEVTRRVLLETSALPTMTAVAPDGRWAVYASPALDSLSLVRLDDATTDLLLDGFSAFTIDQAGALWVAGQGAVRRIDDVEDPSRSEVVAELDEHLTAIDVDVDGAGFTAMTDEADLLRFDRRDGAFDLTDRTALFPDGPTGYGADDVDRDYAVDRLLVCGPYVVVHRGTTWAAATPDGVVRSDVSDPSLFGEYGLAAGCMGDAALSLYLRPPLQTVPDDAPMPVGLVRDEDGFGSYAFASDPERRHLVVARPDGVVDVYDLDRHPTEVSWERAFAAAPVGDGVVAMTVDLELWWRGPDGATRRIGDLPGFADGVRPLALGGRAVFATANGLALVTERGLDASITLGVQPTALVATGDELLVATDDGIVHLADVEGLEGDVDMTDEVVKVDGLEEDEAIRAVAPLPDGGSVATTNLGRLVVVADDGEVERAGEGGPALAPVGVAVVDGRIITYGTDGVIRELGRDLQVRQAELLPGSGRSLTASADGRALLATTVDGRLLVIDPASLLEVQSLASDIESGPLFQFSPDGGSVVGMELASTGEDETGEIRWDNRLQTYPLHP